MATSSEIHKATTRVAQDDWGRLLAALISTLRDFQLAEDCLQEAFASALDHWARGIPENPQGWLLQTARRKAIDRIRRQKNLNTKLPDLALLMEMDREDSAAEQAQEIPDERLRLIFTACHPSLDQKTQVALTLRTLCGLTTTEIASAFLDKEPAMAQRLVRARQKITKAGIPFVVPEPDAWTERLNSVLTVIYLIFNEGYSSLNVSEAAADLVEEALRLANLLDYLQPDEEEVQGLIALMQLTYARAAAQNSEMGALVPLEEQDRALWDHQKAAIARTNLEAVLRRGRPGPFQLQAAIAAIHSEAERFEDTGWHEIVLIYDRLIEITPNPVLRLNQAVAISYDQGAEFALRIVEPLNEALDEYQSYHAVRADLCRRLNKPKQAIASYQRAIQMSRNESDKRFLSQKLSQIKK